MEKRGGEFGFEGVVQGRRDGGGRRGLGVVFGRRDGGEHDGAGHDGRGDRLLGGLGLLGEHEQALGLSGGDRAGPGEEGQKEREEAKHL